MYRYGLKLRPKERHKALWIGDMWHQAMDGWWEVGLDEARKRLNDSIEGLIEDGVSDDSVCHSLILLHNMLEGYDERWRHLRPVTTLLSTEQTLEAQIRLPTGHKSRFERVAGKIDKIARIDGRLFIVDHKTSGWGLDVWERENANASQAYMYVWLAWQNGIKVDGIIYDVARKAYPLEPSGWKVTTRGRLSKTIPKDATLDTLNGAMKALGQEEDIWYREAVKRIKERGDRFFKRVFIYPTVRDMDHINSDIYAMVSRIGRWIDAVGDVSIGDIKTVDGELNAVKTIESTEERVKFNIDRNTRLCMDFNRKCDFLDLCHKGAYESGLGGYRVASTEHEEL